MATPRLRPKPPSPVDTGSSDFTSRSRRNARAASNRGSANPSIRQIDVQSSLSTSFLYEATRSFTEQQRQIVEGVGFSFIFSLPGGHMTSRPFSVWLLSHVQYRGAEVVFAGEKDYELRRSDIEDILGIPGGATPIRKEKMEMSEESVEPAQRKHTREAFGVTGSIKTAQNIIKRLKGKPMTSHQARTFGSAVVIYAVGKFLAPRSGSGSGDVDEEVIEALVGTTALAEYDWQGYVLAALAEGAESVRRQLGEGCPGGYLYLSGCTTLLLVFYYTRIVGRMPAHRDLDRPLIYMYTGEMLNSLKTEDPERRKDTRSWKILTHKQTFDTKAFLEEVARVNVPEGQQDRAPLIRNMSAKESTGVCSTQQNPQKKRSSVQIIEISEDQDNEQAPGHSCTELKKLKRTASVNNYTNKAATSSDVPVTQKRKVNCINESAVSAIVRDHVVDILKQILGPLLRGPPVDSTPAQHKAWSNHQICELVKGLAHNAIRHCLLEWMQTEKYLPDKPCTAEESEMRETDMGVSNYVTTAAVGSMCSRQTTTYIGDKRDQGNDEKQKGNVVLYPIGESSSELEIMAELPQASEVKQGADRREEYDTTLICRQPSSTPDDITPEATRSNMLSRSGGSGTGPVYDTYPHEETQQDDLSKLRMLSEAAVMSRGHEKGQRSAECGIGGHASKLVESTSVNEGENIERNRSQRNEQGKLVNPFQLGIESILPSDKHAICLDNFLHTTNFDKSTLRKVWVQFHSPVNIKLRGEEIMRHYVHAQPYTLKMMGVIMSLFKELDDKVHQNSEGPRWRFFIDPRFTDNCLYGGNECKGGESYPLIEHPCLHSNAIESEMGILPVLVGADWICLAIHMQKQKITAFQPVCKESKRYLGEDQLHRIVDKILGSVLPVLGAVRGLAYPEPSSCELEIYDWMGPQTARDEEGDMVAMFGLFYDGYTVVRDMAKASSTLQLNAQPKERQGFNFKRTVCSLLLERTGNPLKPSDLGCPY